MKRLSRITIVLFALMIGSTSRGGSSDVEIHCAAKKVDEKRNPGSGEGSVATTKERWVYDVTVENKTFKEQANIEIKYIIFVNGERLGQKAAAAPAMRRQSGSVTLPSLKSHEKKALATDPIELKKANLVGGYYYPSGAKPGAQDALAGLWVRVYQDGQQIGEYANPSTLLREKWEQ